MTQTGGPDKRAGKFNDLGLLALITIGGSSAANALERNVTGAFAFDVLFYAAYYVLLGASLTGLLIVVHLKFALLDRMGGSLRRLFILVGFTLTVGILTTWDAVHLAADSVFGGKALCNALVLEANLDACYE